MSLTFFECGEVWKIDNQIPVKWFWLQEQGFLASQSLRGAYRSDKTRRWDIVRFWLPAFCQISLVSPTMCFIPFPFSHLPHAVVGVGSSFLQCSSWSVLNSPSPKIIVKHFLLPHSLICFCVTLLHLPCVCFVCSDFRELITIVFTECVLLQGTIVIWPLGFYCNKCE